MGEEIEKPSSAIVVPVPATAEANVSNEPATGNEISLPPPPPPPPPKKKRNLPGTPDPDAEVIALSPKTLLATNRFVCEVCNKGFQRHQNLQLHRRGHKLPWELRQRTNNKEIKKKVYVCPEPTCVHHHPSRALGDLTGIKKHFCRKHGEKKWKCECCSKKYAVQSDWKAHMKTCGIREYRCVCGTLFSRRDSFIMHRAFCDALAIESAKSQPQILAAVGSDGGSLTVEVEATAQKTSASPPPPLTPSSGVVSPVLSVQSSELSENQTGLSQQHSLTANNLATAAAVATTPTAPSGSSTSSGKVSSSNGVFATIFTSPAPAPAAAEVSQSAQSPSSFSSLLRAMTGSDRAMLEPMSLSLSCSSLYYSNEASHLFPTTEPEIPNYTPPIQPALSATALLQKAAQMGATTSNSSFLHGLGLTMSSPSGLHDHHSTTTTAAITTQWGDSHALPAVRHSRAFGIGLGLRSDDLMTGSSTLFASEPTTLDLLGLGDLGAGGQASSGLSALISIGRGFDVSAAASFEGVKSGGSEA